MLSFGHTICIHVHIMVTNHFIFSLTNLFFPNALFTCHGISQRECQSALAGNGKNNNLKTKNFKEQNTQVSALVLRSLH